MKRNETGFRILQFILLILILYTAHLYAVLLFLFYSQNFTSRYAETFD